MDVARLWPAGLKPRRGQLEAARLVADALRGGQSVALDAPTGWGKTLTTIIALRASGYLPVLWLCRALPVGTRVLEDASRVGLRVFVAAGREKTCLADVDREDVHDYCKYYRYRCPYFIGLDADKIPRFVQNYEDLVELGKELGFCPYYAQDFLISRADIVVQSYWRRRHAVRCIVADEAHNLLLPKECTMPLDSLNDAIAVLQRCPTVRSGTLKKLERFKEFAEEIQGTVDVAAFVDEEAFLDIAVARRHYLEHGVGGVLGKLLKVLQSDVVYVEGGALAGLRAARVQLPRPYVLLSGTLLPRIREVLEVDVFIEIPRRRPKAYILSWLTTRYGEFEEEENLRAYRRLLTTLKLRAKRVLAFGTSRVIRMLRSGVDYFEDEIVRVPSEWSGLMLLKTRGRFAEGVDIEADAVVVLGAPYMTPDVIQRLARVYRRLGYSSYWELASDVPMLIATLQCIGRATRRPSARPLILLADERFEKFEEELSKYLDVEELGSEGELRRLLYSNHFNA